MLSKENLLPESVKKLGENPFLDSYVMEFLNLPNEFHENDLRKALIKNMKDFILELGKDFTFIDEEYKVQVGGDDFRIDLLFYHRGLQCLVAIELKIGKFKPEYISKLDFYLETLDRQVKKDNENPSVGLLLCAAKNDGVVCHQCWYHNINCSYQIRQFLKRNCNNWLIFHRLWNKRNLLITLLQVFESLFQKAKDILSVI